MFLHKTLFNFEIQKCGQILTNFLMPGHILTCTGKLH